ncbi:MAG: hypothetical protein EAX91_17545, partial [Candidatus Lokiarchaeota archaeon]|nr:hypothetical protein [Candidatus Lokiarchaeota archaeon]
GIYNQGIQLTNVNNSQLIDNDCSFVHTIDFDRLWMGIVLSDCYNNTVLGNTINSTNYLGIGICIYRSHNNIVSRNTVNKGDDGIRLENSEYNVISKNIANDNRKAGIILHESDNNDISENIVCDGRNGISLDESDFNTISGNIITENDYNGIYLYFSKHNNISENIANYNNYGVFLYFSNYNIISGNTLKGNTKCIKEEYCEVNIIKDNEYCSNDIIPGYNLLFLLFILSTFIIILSNKLINYNRKRIKTRT